MTPIMTNAGLDYIHTKIYTRVKDSKHECHKCKQKTLGYALGRGKYARVLISYCYAKYAIRR